MSGRGVWNERPPGTEDDLPSDCYRDATYSHNQHSSVETKKRPSHGTQSKGFQGHGSSRRGDLEHRSDYREDYSRSRNYKRSHSRSPKNKSRTSRSPSFSKGKSRRNRKSTSSPSSSDSSRSSSSSYRKRSHSRSGTSQKETDRFNKIIQEKSQRSRSPSSSSTDSSSSRKRKNNRQCTSPDDRRSGIPQKSNIAPRSTNRIESRGNPSTTRYQKMGGHNSKLALQRQSAVTTPKSQMPPVTQFKNDGSFLEMFKKMQEAQKSTDPAQSTQSEPTSTQSTQAEQMKKPAVPLVGKRRGGRVLKTGMVKKAKTIEEQTVDNNPVDAWSLYLQEVKKYRETSCEEEGKTRPLVK